LNFEWQAGWEMDQARWMAIEEILASRGWMSLNRNTTMVRLATEEGRIIGFLCLQLIPHTEPLYVDKAYRASGVAERLAEDMVKWLAESGARGFMLVADSPHAEKLAERYGMVKVDSPVYMTLSEPKGNA
jgi:GNAT superfamily N-acetyltransferase